MIKENILQYQHNWQTHFSKHAADWLSPIRKQQLDQFLAKGFPDTRDENWKYTNLTALAATSFDVAAAPELLAQEAVMPLLMADNNNQLVFVQGHFQPHLSRLTPTKNMIICNLATALQQYQTLIQPYITAPENNSAFVDLNTAYMQEGAFICFPAYAQLDQPIHLLFLGSGPGLQTVRNIIVVGKNANVTLVEEHYSLTDQVYFANIVTQLEAQQGANVHYIKLQQQHAKSFHIANMHIAQERSSHVATYYYHLGSQIARDDIHILLKEQGASLQMQGLYLPVHKQHIDVHTHVHHLADQTHSEALFKGVVASQSHAVFNGKISVDKNRRQIVANLQNKNLLLARNAEINTKPELEIYSNDVKCKHGATIGQIDPAMLFYLRARGISYQEAYRLLLLAFVREHLSDVAQPVIAAKILLAVTDHLQSVMQ